MSSLSLKIQAPTALKVTVDSDSLAVDLSDGRTVLVPLVWYPRLLHGSLAERNNWRLIGGGAGINWPDLDEDLSVEGIVFGRASEESPASLKRWLESRDPGAKQARATRPRAVRQSLRTGRTTARRR